MISVKCTLARVLPALAVGGLLMLVAYSVAVAASATTAYHHKHTECSINDRVIQVFSSPDTPLQCLDQDGSYTLAAGGKACNESLTQYIVAPLKPALARKYGFSYQEYGRCIHGAKGGTTFKIVPLPIVKDLPRCQQAKGIFVTSLLNDRTLLQCLQQSGIYNIQKIVKACNFTTSSVATVGAKPGLMLAPGSACYQHDDTNSNYSHSITFMVPTRGETA
jgi:hypothetical protein